MRPYTREDNNGRSMAGHDIHHRTADLSPKGRKLVAKRARHGVRQQAKELSNKAV